MIWGLGVSGVRGEERRGREGVPLEQGGVGGGLGVCGQGWGEFTA